MPGFRVPTKQGVVLVDEPIDVEGPTNEDSTPASPVRPLLIGGIRSQFGWGGVPGTAVNQWLTPAGATVAGAYSFGSTGNDNPAEISYLPVSNSGFPGVNPIPLSVAGFVYNSGTNTWARMRGSASGVSTKPGYLTATIQTATTSATGTNFVQLGNQACESVDICNNTGTTIEYRRNGLGSAMQIPDGATRLIVAITNTNEISIRRTDTSNTQVTVTCEAFS
jgi:hypothetical protein